MARRSRFPGLSPATSALAALSSWAAITVLVWGQLLALLILKRVRHLLVVVVAWTVQGVLIQYLLGPLLRRATAVRGRVPDRLVRLGAAFRADGCAHRGHDGDPVPRFVPAGRWRRIGKWAAAVVLAVIAIARMHLGVESTIDTQWASPSR